MICKVKDLTDVLAQWDPNMTVEVEAEVDASEMKDGVEVLDVRARFKKCYIDYDDI